MFRVVNYSSNTNVILAEECANIRETGDAVFAITKDENEASKVERIAKSMHFGDIYSAKLYRVTCIDPSIYPVAGWEITSDGTLRCPTCGYEPKGRIHTYEPTPYCIRCGTRMSVEVSDNDN